MSTFKVAVDVHYDDEGGIAYAAAVVFSAWTDAEPVSIEQYGRMGIEPYVSGEFYRRELPVLQGMLREVEEEHAAGVVIVDGHVDLGPDRPGLGRHLFDAVAGRFDVIGVAKNEFVGAPSRAVLRGGSERPLWVSSTGDVDAAVAAVESMHGEHRIPTLLRLVDQHARRG